MKTIFILHEELYKNLEVDVDLSKYEGLFSLCYGNQKGYSEQESLAVIKLQEQQNKILSDFSCTNNLFVTEHIVLCCIDMIMCLEERKNTQIINLIDKHKDCDVVKLQILLSLFKDLPTYYVDRPYQAFNAALTNCHKQFIEGSFAMKDSWNEYKIKHVDKTNYHFVKELPKASLKASLMKKFLQVENLYNDSNCVEKILKRSEMLGISEDFFQYFSPYSQISEEELIRRKKVLEDMQRDLNKNGPY